MSVDPSGRSVRCAVRTLAIALLVLSAARVQAQLTVRVPALPPRTPAGATLYVAGPFNGWNPSASPLARQPDGAWTITLPDSVRGRVELKLTRGSWATVEIAANGADVPNRVVAVPPAGATTYTATVGGWRDDTTLEAPPKPSTRTASVRVVSDTFAIASLGRTRRVWIYLPPGYATSRARYPVLYLQDGQNVFDAATAGAAGEWGVDESLDSLRAHGDPGAIVVAVDHGAEHRIDEYDPWRAVDPKLGGGEGDAYVDFLVRTLKPWIDARYRTRPDAAHTAIVGSSMGGLIALYATLRHPETFGAAGVFSCACWIADPQIYALARAARPGRTPPRFYFVSGLHEGDRSGPAVDQRRVADSLRAAGFPAASVRVLAPADGKHSEWFWRREFPRAYRWLIARSR